MSFKHRSACFVIWLLLVWASVAGEPFRFAFVSDTHIGSSTAEADLRATVADINGTPGIAFVVISGDITEYGTREQLQLAKAVLDNLRVPYHIIPGNHDMKWSESGGTDFSRVWEADRFTFEHGGYRFIGLHQGPVLKMGDGHWAPQDVRWLEQTLRSLPDPRQPIIFVTHYPIDKGIANWYVVLDLLKRYNVQAVLCGHGHSSRKMNFEGVPGVMGRSNLRAKQHVGGYNLVEISDAAMRFTERAPGGPEAMLPWHELPLLPHNFAADTNQYERPDFTVNKRFPGVKRTWRIDTGYTIASSPAVADELAVVGDAFGLVRAIDIKSGSTRWSFQTKGAVYSTPAAADSIVVVASTDGTVYGLRIKDGSRVWALHTPRPIVAAPVIESGIVYIGSSEGKFRALEAVSGKLKWEWTGARNYIETRPLVTDGLVVFGAWDEHLYALRDGTGELMWKWRGDKAGALLSPAACWPVSASGKIFIVAPDRKMTAVDSKTGTQIWRTGDWVVRESIGISGDGRRVYARSMNDAFYAFDTRAESPVKVWETNAGFGYDINSAMLVEKEGVVFYGTKNGLLFALDGLTGRILWQHKIGNGILNTPVPLSAHRVLLTNFDGEMVLVENSSHD